MTTTLILGDCLERLKELPNNSIDCCITSPPYWGLRDYSACSCSIQRFYSETLRTYGGANRAHGVGGTLSPNDPRCKKEPDPNCPLCKGTGKNMDVANSQLGLEDTPEEYVAKMVVVFREVRRALKKTGTLWLNLGDSYAGVGGYSKRPEDKDHPLWSEAIFFERPKDRGVGGIIKQKDLVGIPWRVAFALQADGWYLRQDIIWNKPNPMPESCTDRCTKSHEYIFLLAKNPQYFFDSQAIKEPAIYALTTGDNRPPGVVRDRLYGYDSKEAVLRGRIVTQTKTGITIRHPHGKHGDRQQSPKTITDFRNKRSVWTVTTKPFKDAHFATFPEDLILPCVLAGCPRYVCTKCGKPREKIIEREAAPVEVFTNKNTPPDAFTGSSVGGKMMGQGQKLQSWRSEHPDKFIGFTDCGCNAEFGGGVVLDPFMGAGTTGVVAKENNRNFIGIELNPKYLEMSRNRIENSVSNSLTDFIKIKEEE